MAQRVNQQSLEKIDVAMRAVFMTKYTGLMNETISMAATGLKVGERTRDVLCPFCDGGQSKEKSFSIFKAGPDEIKYRCWRLTCNKKGIVTSTGEFFKGEPDALKLITSESGISTAVGHARRYFSGVLGTIKESGYELFLAKFGLTANDLKAGRVFHEPRTDRYIFPVESPRGGLRGYTLRTFDEKSNFPKWDHYPNLEADTWMGWYVRPNVMMNPVVIVEDPISALKVSRHFVCGYLMGTELSLVKLTEILKFAGGVRVRLALDGDAYNKSIEIIKKWSFFINDSVDCVRLEKDLKYSSDREIKSILDSWEKN